MDAILINNLDCMLYLLVSDRSGFRGSSIYGVRLIRRTYLSLLAGFTNELDTINYNSMFVFYLQYFRRTISHNYNKIMFIS